MIPISLLLLADEEADGALAAVLSGSVSHGPQVAAFERDFAALVGAPSDCVAPAQGHHSASLKHRREADRTYGSLKGLPSFAAL